MRKLTLKDFLTFYTPCLACKDKVNLTWSVKEIVGGHNSFSSSFSPILEGKNLTVDLKTTYFNKFSLRIDIVSHSFISSDSGEFLKYIGESECFIHLKCFKCNSQVMTTNLKFDTSRRLLYPVGIKGEIWHLMDDEHIYNVFTNMDKEESEIIVDKINATTPLTPWRKTLEALPINRFNSKEEFLERIKTYMVFS